MNSSRKKSIITIIITALSFIVTISLISVNVYAQQQDQQQQDQAASFIVPNTSKSMREPLQGNESSPTQLEIKRSGSQASTKGSDAYFTGTVRIDPLFQAKEPARAAAASVTFEPSARTAWHTHPLGQILIVTAGCGMVQLWGGTIEKICPGDVVRIPPGEKHWHGASPTTSMTHIAIQEQLNGKVVDWMEKVTDEQYQQAN